MQVCNVNFRQYVWYRSKVMLHSLAFFSRVNWSTRGEQRVEEMMSQANTRLEPLAMWSSLHTVFPSLCCKSCCKYLSENLILYYPSYVYSAASAGKISLRQGF